MRIPLRSESVCYCPGPSFCALTEHTAGDHPGLRKVGVDGGCRERFVEHAAGLGLEIGLGVDLEIVERTPTARPP
ncbi:hypothetical protein [Streptomyces sp. NPDC101776]|uniref:hypothetical protein n=1 Tax=Streptomyces sp. NPDC101776 TaxID=3366146 RepID=UPI00380F3C6B